MNSVKVKELDILEIIQRCFCETRMIYFSFEYWLMTKNESFITTVNDWFNGLIMTNYPNTFQNRNCVNRRVC